MTLSMVPRGTIHLGQTIHPFIGILSQPMATLDRVIYAIIDNPDMVLDNVVSLSEPGSNHPPNKLQFLENLIKYLTTSRTSDTGILPSVFGESPIMGSGNNLLAEPDVTYKVQGKSGCIIRPSGHFNALDIQPASLDIPKSAQSILQQLVSQKKWMLETLLQVYGAIEKYQVAFLYSLEPLDLVELPQTRLPNLPGRGYTQGIYSRLLRGRNVAIESPNGTANLPVRFLLPHQEQVTKYAALHLMNIIFEEEAAKGETYSDIVLKNMISMVSRRTLQGYRHEFQIPDHRERLFKYNRGRTTPYRAVSPIESHIKRNQNLT